MAMFKTCFLYFLLLLYDTQCKPQEIRCPGYCKCDVFEALRRATCQHKKLVSIEVDIPPQAEILDLAYNQISELGSHIFPKIGLSNLKLLNLSHNKVSQIHLDGFDGLSTLKTLDLSFNMLRYFLEQWFVSLNSLQELYLRGNNLKSINEEPRLNLPHLKVLDISQCAIIGLKPGVFDGIPALEVLNISENFLVNIDIKVISSLERLNTLILNDNNFDCNNGNMAKLKKYTSSKGIAYKDPCVPKGRVGLDEKFQRMMAPEPAAPERNVWIYDDEEENMTKAKIIEICSGNQTRWDSDGIVMDVIRLSPILSVLTVLVFGILIGLVIGCSIEIGRNVKQQTDDYINLPDGVTPYRRRCRSVNSENFQRQDSTSSAFRPRTRSGGSRKMIREDRSILIVNECGLSDSTPVISRKVYL